MIYSHRATGRTTRAVLKAARQLSKGKRLVLLSEGRENETRYFMQRLLDLVSYMGFLNPAVLQDRQRITTVGGGVIYRIADTRGAAGLRFDALVTDV